LQFVARFYQFLSHFVDGVHNPVNLFVGNWRSRFHDRLAVEAADFW